MRLWMWCVVLGLCLCLGGEVERRVSRNTFADPTEVTCAELEAAEVLENNHVMVTDCVLSEQLVYESEMRIAGEDPWTWAWIPASSPGAAADPGFRVVFMTSAISSEAEVEDYLKRTSIQGLVVNAVRPLGGEVRSLLAKSYPGIAIDRLWVVQEGRKPRTRVVSFAMFGGGALLLLVGLWLRLARNTAPAVGPSVARLGGLLVRLGRGWQLVDRVADPQGEAAQWHNEAGDLMNVHYFASPDPEPVDLDDRAAFDRFARDLAAQDRGRVVSAGVVRKGEVRISRTVFEYPLAEGGVGIAGGHAWHAGGVAYAVKIECTAAAGEHWPDPLTRAERLMAVIDSVIERSPRLDGFVIEGEGLG